MVELGIDDLTDAVEIGGGGFARVYMALAPGLKPPLKRRVAVKVFGVHVNVTKATLKVFDHEIDAIIRLQDRSRNLLQVYRCGLTATGRPYMVMEYMPGGSLEGRVERSGAIPWLEAIDIAIKLAKALQIAHDAGVLHLDVKPDNVLISDDDEPVLADFGTARRTDGTRTKSRPAITPLYVAPEVAAGEEPTEAADIYSLATTLFTLLAGRPAFARRASDPAFDPTTDGNIFVILKRVREEPPPDLREEGPPPDLLQPRQVPESVWRVVERTMAKKPSERPSSAAAFAKELQKAREQAQREQAQREQAQREQAQREQAQREQAQREQAQREQAPTAPRTPLVSDRQVGNVLQLTLEGHTKEVTVVAVTPDGRAVVSGSDDGTVRVWDLASGRLERTLETAHELPPPPERRKRRLRRPPEPLKPLVAWVDAVAVTPDGQRIVSSGAGNLLLWDLASGRLERTLNQGGYGTSSRSEDLEFSTVAVTPDGQRIVSGSDSSPVMVWDLPSGRLERSLGTDENWVWALTVTPDGQRIVSSGNARGPHPVLNPTVYVWNLASGELEHSFEPVERTEESWWFLPAVTVAVTPDGQQIVSVPGGDCDDRTIGVWDLASGRLECWLAGTYERYVDAVAVTPDGNRIVCASNYGVGVWNLASGQFERHLEMEHTGNISALAVTPDGQRLVSGSDDGAVRVWDLGHRTSGT